MTQPTSQLKIRSLAQNRALHKWCEEMAQHLSESGISMSLLFRNIQADYSMELIKEFWRLFGKAKFGVDGTSKLTTKQLQEVYEEVVRHFSQYGIECLPFPSQELTDNYLGSYEETNT